MNRRFQILVLHDYQTNHKSLSQCSNWSVLFYLTLMNCISSSYICIIIAHYGDASNKLPFSSISVKHIHYKQHTVHGHKYSSPPIFYYIFHIKPPFFKKNILKLSLVRFLRNLFQDTQNSLKFFWLSDSNFCLHDFCFLVI